MAAATLTTLFVSLFLLILLLVTPLQGIDIENPVVDVTPYALPDHSSIRDPKHVISCERVRVSGLSRLKLGSYASSFRVTLSPSTDIPERLHSKIQVCYHRNASLGLCQCEKDDWKDIQKGGIWNFVMSPYEDRYVDVKVVGKVSVPVSVAVVEDFQRWRLFFLASGFVLLLLAPIVSSWVYFYYSSSMVIGVLLVIMILLFQGMKLLPTGRKNVFYLSIYGSMLGAGSFLLHHLSMLVHSLLENFGLSVEMHTSVSILLLLLIVFTGAALGFWVVRKYVISDDGTVDGGIAQFVKWSMRIVATTAIFQSTHDNLLALGALISCYTICFIITSPKWVRNRLSRPRQASRKYGQAEFLSRSPVVGSGGKQWNSPKIHKTPLWSNSPVKGIVTPSSRDSIINQKDYYSTFHKTGKRRRYTKQEWEDFTRDSTREAVAELASSPEFTDWVIDHADRIKLLPTDDSSDELVGSESDSTDENLVQSCSRFNLFSWL